MEAIIKRHKPSSVRSGKVALPKSLEPIKWMEFIALLERKTKGKRSWRVGLSSKTATFLIRDRDELQQLKKDHREIKAKCDSQSERLTTALRENKNLQDTNKTLMRNIEADKRSAGSTYPKSPKNYFDAAEDRGFKANGRPMQGGLPGLGKRR